MTARSVQEAFLSAAPGDLRPELEALEDLAARIEALVLRASEPWPGIHVPTDVFASWAGARISSCDESWFDQVVASDLYLACACVAGDQVAIEHFQHQLMAPLRPLLSRVLPDTAAADDVLQNLAQQMLASAPGRQAGLASYDGTGRLSAWLRVCVLRDAVRARKRAGIESPAEDLGQAMPAVQDDPELAYMRQLYRSEFRQAFQEAAASLEPRERTLLRYSVVDGLTVDDLGRLFQVHRASAARWVADARDKLTKRTRAALAQRLGVRVRDQESILRLVQSQLDLSLGSILEEPDEPVRKYTKRRT